MALTKQKVIVWQLIKSSLLKQDIT